MKIVKNVTLFTALGMVIIGVIMTVGALASVKFDFTKLVRTVEYEEKTYDITEDFSNINMQVDSQDVWIERSDDENTHFVCYECDSEWFEVSVQDGTLVIDNKQYDQINIMVNMETGDHSTLYLPKDVYENLSVKNGSGDLVAKKDAFTFEDIDVTIGSGDVTLANMSADDLILYAGSGDLNMDSIDAGSADLKCGSGDISVANCNIDDFVNGKVGSGDVGCSQVSCNSVNFHTDSGDVTVNGLSCKSDIETVASSGDILLTDAVTETSFTVSTGSGNILLAACDAEEMELKTGSGDITGTLRSAKKFDAKTGSGDIRVPSDGDNGTCTAKTGSGDIELSLAE